MVASIVTKTKEVVLNSKTRMRQPLQLHRGATVIFWDKECPSYGKMTAVTAIPSPGSRAKLSNRPAQPLAVRLCESDQYPSRNVRTSKTVELVL